MEKTKQNKNIRSGLAYFIGLILGAAVTVAFAVGMGATFFGITLGLSVGLFIGIFLECVIVGDKKLFLVQKIILCLSVVLLVISIISIYIWRHL